MGAVGKQQRQQGLSAGGLSDLLRKESDQIEKESPGGGLMARMLDQDGDGDFDMSDMMKVGMKFLSRKR